MKYLKSFDEFVNEKKIDEAVVIPYIPSFSHTSGIESVPSNPYAIIAAGLIVLTGLGIAAADAEGLFTKLSSWWTKRKRNKQIDDIVFRLKDDKDILDFLKLPLKQQEGKWKKLLTTKLTEDEMSSLNHIGKGKFI